jgi:hypothetical protein
VPEPTRSIYVIGTGRDGVVKIGIARDPGARLRELQTGNPQPLRLLGLIPGDGKLERRLHEHFATRCIAGEWFDFGEFDAVAAVKAVAHGSAPLPPVHADDLVLNLWSLFRDDEHFLPSGVLVARLGRVDDAWATVTLRAGSMRLVSMLAARGVLNVRRYVDGCQRRGYRRMDLATSEVGS